jgi:hypothetical protein
VVEDVERVAFALARAAYVLIQQTCSFEIIKIVEAT